MGRLWDENFRRFVETFSARNYRLMPSPTVYQGAWFVFTTAYQKLFLEVFDGEWSSVDIGIEGEQPSSCLGGDEVGVVFEREGKILFLRLDPSSLTTSIETVRAGFSPSLFYSDGSWLCSLVGSSGLVVMQRTPSGWIGLSPPYSVSDPSLVTQTVLRGGEVALLGYLEGDSAYVVRSLDFVSWSAPLYLTDAEWFDFRVLPTGHVLFVFEKDSKLYSAVSRDFCESLDDLVEVEEVPNCIAPSIVLDGDRAHVVFSDPTYGFVLSSRVLPFFAYRSRTVDLRSLISSFVDVCEYKIAPDCIFWAPDYKLLKLEIRTLGGEWRETNLGEAFSVGP